MVVVPPAVPTLADNVIDPRVLGVPPVKSRRSGDVTAPFTIRFPVGSSSNVLPLEAISVTLACDVKAKTEPVVFALSVVLLPIEINDPPPILPLPLDRFILAPEIDPNG